MPKQTPRPPYLGPLGYGKLQEQAQRGGCQNTSTRSIVRHFGPSKVKECQQQATLNGQKSQLHCGALDSAEILVDGTYRCEGQSHKVRATNSTVAANECHKWRTSVSKIPIQGQTESFLPKTALELVQNGQTKGTSAYTLYAASLPRVKEPSRDCNSATCPINAPKWPPKAPEFVYTGRSNLQSKDKPYLGLCVSKNDSDVT